MDTRTSTSGATSAIKPHDQAQLLSKARLIDIALNDARKSIAARHKLSVIALQLRSLVDELHAADIVGDQAAAIGAAIDDRSWDAAREAINALESAVRGDAAEVPASSSPLPIGVGVPANDNHEGSTPPICLAPERKYGPPEPAHLITTAQQAADEQGDVTDRDQISSTPGQVAAVLKLGEAIRAARLRLGKNQHDVAIAAGVGRRFVGEVEAGKPTAEIGRYLAVCAAVSLSLVAVEA